MRLHFTLSPNTERVPFNYQHFLTGRFHAWLGKNDIHDDISLYSLSWLYGGKRDGNGLTFPNGATWFISGHADKILQKIMDTALQEREVCQGMLVTEVRVQRTPDFSGHYKFRTGSPVLARGADERGQIRHYLYSDKEADAILTQTLRHKLDLAGLGSLAQKVKVLFDRNYRKAHTKLVTIKGIANRASICPVIVDGPAEAVQFAWNVGIGHLTGSGFGSLL